MMKQGDGKPNGRGCPEWLKPHQIQPGQVLNPTGKNQGSHAQRFRSFMHDWVDKKCVITNEDGKKEELEADAETTHVFLCGNPGMIQAAQEWFAALGFRPDEHKKPGNMHTEKYWS